MAVYVEIKLKKKVNERNFLFHEHRSKHAAIGCKFQYYIQLMMTTANCNTNGEEYEDYTKFIY